MKVGIGVGVGVGVSHFDIMESESVCLEMLESEPESESVCFKLLESESEICIPTPQPWLAPP